MWIYKKNSRKYGVSRYENRLKKRTGLTMKKSSISKLAKYWWLILIVAMGVTGAGIWANQYLNSQNSNPQYENSQSVNYQKIIPIAMALDDGYVLPTVVAVTSIMENSDHKTQHDFHIMHPDELKEENKAKLLTLQKKYNNCKINLINMKDQFKDAFYDRHITTPTYYRLALSDLLPKLDKIIWLDGDTLTFKPLGEMFAISMDGYCYRGFLEPNPDFTRSLGEKTDNFICAGVMLINLKELRENNMVEKFNQFINEKKDKLTEHDQTTINVVCKDKIGALPAKFGRFNIFNLSHFGIFNAFNSKEDAVKYTEEILTSPNKYTAEEMMDAYKNPVVLHCTSKPWHSLEVNFASTWWEYAEKSDFFKEIQEKYLISDGIYEITSDLDSNKALSIASGSTKNDAILQINGRKEISAQKFNIAYVGEGLFTIQAKCSGKMLEAQEESKGLKAKLWQRQQSDTSAQKWYITNKTKTGDLYSIISKSTGLFVNVDPENLADEAQVWAIPKNDTNSQKFKFIK